MIKKRYTVDLSGQQAECEANYARIMQLFPDMLEIDARQVGMALAGQGALGFVFRVTERCKYTTMMDIIASGSRDTASSHTANLESWQPDWSKPLFSLRIYHDARMAEMVSYNHHRHLLPSYEYPNNNMYQRDEKSQLNKFLGEWLSHCIHYGHSVDNSLAGTINQAINRAIDGTPGKLKVAAATRSLDP